MINNEIIKYYKDISFIPAKTSARFVTVIITHGNNKPYHIEHFLRHNEDTDVYVIADNRSLLSNELTYVPGSRTEHCLGKTSIIILLRNWWTINRPTIKVDKILSMEFDVLANIKITDDMFTDGVRTSTSFNYFKDILFPPEKTWAGAPWWWGIDGDAMSPELKGSAVETFTNILWFKASALDILALPEWYNLIFNTNIICEASIPTILNYCKVPLYNWNESLGYVRCHCNPISLDTELSVIEKIKSNYPGIYHPVKEYILYK
jgi:hypothetical protein